VRILILSNFYPPARPGGYTQWCHEVAQRLVERGHVIGVLTSRYELAKAPLGEHDVYRQLHLEGGLNYYQPLHFFTKWQAEYRENLATLERVISEFAPDLLFVWGMWAMNIALPARAEQLLPGRVVYYLSDYWPAAVNMHTAYWQAPTKRWVTRLPKRILGGLAKSMLTGSGQPTPKYERAMCVSARVRELLVEAGLPLQRARIVHGGTDVQRFQSAEPRDFTRRPLQLLYAGQLASHKGVHTAIEAVAILVNKFGLDQIRLTLVGSGHPKYVEQLHEQVKRQRIDDYVTFHGSAEKDQIPAIVQAFDVLVFPSIYEEPLARITQEAMASGLLVVGTTTGGSREILKEGETGFTFAPDNPNDLAEQLVRIVNAPDLCARVARTGHHTVLDHFTLDRMAAEIDAYLVAAFGNT
jgi:glycosyltransferase involved in cell wall biosynthesis